MTACIYCINHITKEQLDHVDFQLIDTTSENLPLHHSILHSCAGPTAWNFVPNSVKPTTDTNRF